MAIFNSYVKLPEGTGTQTHRDILMGKTMPFLPPMTGNGKFIPPIKKVMMPGGWCVQMASNGTVLSTLLQTFQTHVCAKRRFFL